VRGKHLREAGDLANLNMHLHRKDRKRPRHGVYGGGRLPTGERRRGARLGRNKREAGRSFFTTRWSLDDQERERETGEMVAVEIDAGGRASTGGGGELDWCERDPTDSNRYTCEPRARRKSEGERLRSFTDGEGSRAAAMARRTALQLGGKGSEGTGRRGSLGVGEGEAEGGPGCLNRHGKGGEAASRRPWPSMVATLIGIKGGEVKEGLRPIDEGERSGASLQLLIVF
jgi:hypothetical protein